MFKKADFKARSIRSDNSDKKKECWCITISYLKICSQPQQKQRSIATAATTATKAQMQTDKQEQEHRSQCNRIKDQGRRICLKTYMIINKETQQTHYRNNISFSK